MKISIVIPVYNSERILNELIDQLKKNLLTLVLVYAQLITHTSKSSSKLKLRTPNLSRL